MAVVAAAAIFAGASGFLFRRADHHQKNLPLAHERELKVTINAGFSDITVAKGAAGEVLRADIEADLKNDLGRYIEYDARDNVGYLTINTSDEIRDEGRKGHHSFHLGSFGTNNWDMRFTDAVPISYDVELGMGKADIDLTGLKVKDLNLSAGASSVRLRIDKPNSTVIEDMNLESGLSKFRAEGLCNANFNHLKFEGGVGSYVLDFGGELHKDADVDIEVGLGTLTVVIPENIGAKISYEKSLVAHIDLASDFSEPEENSYVSANYDNAPGRLNMHIEAGLGSVKIRRGR